MAAGYAGSNPAAAYAVITYFGRGVFTGAVAAQNGNGRFFGHGLKTEFLGYLVHYGLAAYGAEQLGKTGFVHAGAGIGEVMAAGFAASAAVCLRQKLFNFGDFGIFFNGKFF